MDGLRCRRHCARIDAKRGAWDSEDELEVQTE